MPGKDRHHREIPGVSMKEVDSNSGIDNLGLVEEVVAQSTATRTENAYNLQKLAVASLRQPVYLLTNDDGQLLAVPTTGSYADLQSGIFKEGSGKSKFQVRGGLGPLKMDSQANLLFTADDFKAGNKDSDAESASSGSLMQERKINRCMKGLGKDIYPRYMS